MTADTPKGLSAADLALLGRLKATLAISPNTYELLVSAWSQTTAILNAARAEAPGPDAEGTLLADKVLERLGELGGIMDGIVAIDHRRLHAAILHALASLRTPEEKR